MIVGQDRTQVSVKVALAGMADAGKLATLQAIAARFGYATVREDQVASQRIHRVSWTEPTHLPDGRLLNVSVFSLMGEIDYNAAEELLLRDAAGIVFVVDVDPLKFPLAWDRLLRLAENTRRNGYELSSVGLAVQYHRGDLHVDFDAVRYDASLGLPVDRVPRFVSSSSEPSTLVQALDSVLAQIHARLLTDLGR